MHGYSDYTGFLQCFGVIFIGAKRRRPVQALSTTEYVSLKISGSFGDAGSS